MSFETLKGKKILFLDFSSLHGGSFQSLKLICRTLREAGCQCYLFSHGWPSEAGDRELFDRIIAVGGNHRLTGKVNSIRAILRKFAVPGIWVHQWMEMDWLIRFRRTLAEIKPDLVYGNISPLNEATFFRMARKAGIPVVSHVRTQSPRIRYRVVCRWVNEQVSLFVYNSIFTRDMWIGSGLREDGYAIIHNAVHLPGETPPRRLPLWQATESRPVKFLCCGRLVPIKRWHLIIQALAVLKQKAPHLPFRCVFLGDGVEREPLEKQTLELGLSEDICFVGHQNQVEDYFMDADILLHAAQKETFGRIIIEAIHYRAIVLACASGGIKEIIDDGKTGYLFAEYTDRERLADKILSVLQDCYEWPQIVEAAKVSVNKRFSIESHDEAVRKLVAQVL